MVMRCGGKWATMKVERRRGGGHVCNESTEMRYRGREGRAGEGRERGGALSTGSRQKHRLLRSHSKLFELLASSS